jgi:hypothetical protein
MTDLVRSRPETTGATCSVFRRRRQPGSLQPSNAPRSAVVGCGATAPISSHEHAVCWLLVRSDYSIAAPRRSFINADPAPLPSLRC